MASLKEYRDERLKKLEALKKLGVNPYPAHTEVAQYSGHNHLAEDIKKNYQANAGKETVVAGRIVSLRPHGKIAFITVREQWETVQLFLQEDKLKGANYQNSELNFENLNLLDLGDIIEAKGILAKSRTDEITIEVSQLRLLTKSLRPMPSLQDGFTNKEERLRRRYIDINVNQDVYERFIRRSKFWQAHRDFLNKHGFIEINTPVLEHTTGGADANPFVTHMDALGQDFYLRISQELPLKRLLGGGYNKVYDIGPRFRNENYSDEHLPEHTAMEWYWAYADAEDGKKFIVDLFRYVYQQVYGTLQFKIRGFEVDLAKDWYEIDYEQVIREQYDLDVFTCTLDKVKAKLAEHKLEVEKSENVARGIDKLWKKYRATVAGPAFLVNMPVHLKPLAKIDSKNPKIVEHFHPVMAGSELGNGYSELNDPIDQLNRFMEQQNMRDAGDKEAQMLDIDYVEMLEYGMPPACGYGHSERNFWFFEDVTAREGVPFPQLRTEIDEVTKAIYPQIFSRKHPKSK